jgi:hypothetical protein
VRNPCRRSAVVAHAVVVLVLGLGSATPAVAQFGGLKKKLKADAAAQGAASATPASAAPTEVRQTQRGDDGGVVVLTPEVLERLLTGLEAGQADRKRAEQEDTPHGRYLRAVAAYEAARPKCEAAQATFPGRMAKDERMSNRYSAYVDKMVDAQTRGDQRATAAYNDSAMVIMDPSCVVKQPSRSGDYYEAQRAVDSRAEAAEMKASGFSRSELGQARERTEAILRGAQSDASDSEKSAVAARGAALKPLLGIQAKPVTRAAAPAPAPAPAPPASPQVPGATSTRNACMTANMQKHEPEMRALGQRAEAAQKAGNTTALMAIADTLQRLQMAGCVAGQ